MAVPVSRIILDIRCIVDDKAPPFAGVVAKTDGIFQTVIGVPDPLPRLFATRLFEPKDFEGPHRFRVIVGIGGGNPEDPQGGFHVSVPPTILEAKFYVLSQIDNEKTEYPVDTKQVNSAMNGSKEGGFYTLEISWKKEKFVACLKKRPDCQLGVAKDLRDKTTDQGGYSLAYLCAPEGQRERIAAMTDEEIRAEYSSLSARIGALDKDLKSASPPEDSKLALERAASLGKQLLLNAELQNRHAFGVP